MSTLNLLHAIIGFIIGFLACTVTIKEHVASRDHIRNRIIGGGLIILAIVSTFVGVQQIQDHNKIIDKQITCTQKNAKLQNDAHMKLMTAMDKFISTPFEQRTPQMYDELSRSYTEYIKVTEIVDQEKC